MGTTTRALLTVSLLAVLACGQLAHGARPPAAAPKTGFNCQKLDMPPRIMWRDNDGYCGETSIQMAALYYGAWISQFAARAAGGGQQNGGQLLLPLDKAVADVEGIGRNLLMALAALKIDYEWFTPIAGASQSQAQLAFIKASVAAGRPVVFGIFGSDCGPQSDCWDRYDHIVPATAYCTRGSLSGPTVGADDRVGVPGLFSTQTWYRDVSDWVSGPTYPKGTAASCDWPMTWGGCLPQGTGYAVAIKGVQDDNGTSLPVRLAIAPRGEPNAARGRKPSKLKGTVTVGGLTAGAKYRLLRFNSAAALPTTGDAAAFLAAKADATYDFTATGQTYVFKDKMGIKSDATTYYRCVPVA